MTIVARLTRWVMRQWQVTGWFCRVMTPLACLTGMVVARKQAAFASGRRQAHHPGVPVIVVGNILVGGTGKTPVVIAVTQHLQALGMHPGILSRGYGSRRYPDPQVGAHDLDPDRFGDEPALINRQTGAPVAVHARRARAATALLDAFPDIDVIVCDDGLQHLALARDIEIIVQDQRGIGNGHLLPAGPLREPATRLQQVAAVITNHRSLPLTLAAGPAESPFSHSTRKAALPAQGSPGSPSSPLRIDMHIVAGQTRELNGSGRRTLAEWAELSADMRISAVAGIGQPESFFSLLEQAGIRLQHRIGLADHFDYRASPFADLNTDIILVTAKDGVKCHHLSDARLWEVPIEAIFDPPEFPGVLLDALAMANSRRSSVRHRGKLL